MVASTLAVAMRLAHWLGPLASQERAPEGIRYEQLRVPGEPHYSASLYRPAHGASKGAMLVLPGLHFLGPDDPRMDRFCRILAHAGLVTLAPSLPSYRSLRALPRVVHEADRALAILLDHPDRPRGAGPGLFGISFGSFPAIALAASERRARQIGGVITFGGYSALDETLRFCLLGEGDRAHDALNRPVVFMNLLDYAEHVPEGVGEIVDAWRALVARTWGRPELRRGEGLRAIAKELEPAIDEEEARELYWMGAIASPAGDAWALDALARARSLVEALDPKPHLSSLEAPACFVHGREDDVIPFEQSLSLGRAMPPDAEAAVLLTGMYSHSDQASLGETLEELPTLLREVMTLWRVVWAMASVGTRAPAAPHERPR